MSLLATVTTRLGKVELHCEGGRFETRGIIRVPCVDIVVPVDHDYVTTILITVARALEWWELAESEGHVYLPFPRETATIERTS